MISPNRATGNAIEGKGIHEVQLLTCMQGSDVRLGRPIHINNTQLPRTQIANEPNCRQSPLTSVVTALNKCGPICSVVVI